MRKSMNVLDAVSCASLPPAAIAGLASLRTRADIRFTKHADRIWLWWRPGDSAVAEKILPLTGVELFSRQDGLWFRWGSLLPYTGVPGEQDARPLATLLIPDALTPREEDRVPGRIGLTLVRDTLVRPPTALRCSMEDLTRWVDGATSQQMGRLEAARGGKLVLLRGQQLPLIANSERWWGDAILIPLGFRAEPSLPESILRDALQIPAGSLVIISEQGVELVPRIAFSRVTRAGVRLAMKEDG
jgi:hypothetical protein